MVQKILSRCVVQKSLLAVPVFVVLTGCGMGIHAFDQSQVPVISVSNSNPPVFNWQPQAAYALAIYAGEQDGDGLNVLWSARGGGDYENLLQSPVTYGVSPTNSGRVAPALQSGQTYTVTVTRKDPLGSGDGFTNTRHKYVGKQTFVAP